MSMIRFIRPLGVGSLVAAWAVVAGCNLAPHYDRPVVETPVNYKEAAAAGSDVAWNAVQPNDAIQRGKWWEIYSDPSLNAIEEQVQVSNQTILAAEANLRAARAAVTGARSALFPTLGVSPAFTRTRASQTLRSGGTTTIVSSGANGTAPVAAGSTGSAVVDEYSVPFVLNYEVDLWGRLRNGLKASQANAQASAADLATALLSIQAEVAQDYFQLRALDAERKILDETVGSFRQSLDETSSLFRNGIDSQEDVARAETQLNTAVAQATDVGVSRAAFEHALAVLVGKAPANFSLPVADFNARPPAVPTGLPSTLLERRPDVAAAERRASAANEQIGIARSAYFPSLSLGLTGGWQTSAESQLFDWPSRFWSLGPQIAQSIFDGGARRAQTEQARAQFDSAAANYRQTVLGAFQTVEDNLAALRILEQEAREQRVAVNSSQHLLDLANTRFRTGIDSYLNVITAQTTLLTNRETEVQVQLRQIAASISLVRALGGGWSSSQLVVTGNP